jgi:hypothetical protein
METSQPILLICLCLLGFVALILAIVTAGMEMQHAGLILASLECHVPIVLLHDRSSRWLIPLAHYLVAL